MDSNRPTVQLLASIMSHLSPEEEELVSETGGSPSRAGREEEGLGARFDGIRGHLMLVSYLRIYSVWDTAPLSSCGGIQSGFNLESVQ